MLHGPKNFDGGAYHIGIVSRSQIIFHCQGAYNDDLQEDSVGVSQISATAHAQYRHCRVAGHVTGVQPAHICPYSGSEWFTLNGIDQYLQNADYF